MIVDLLPDLLLWNLSGSAICYLTIKLSQLCNIVHFVYFKISFIYTSYLYYLLKFFKYTPPSYKKNILGYFSKNWSRDDWFAFPGAIL